MGLRQYQLESIAVIRLLGNAFDDWDDVDIASFYSDWSEETFCAGWIAMGEKMFYEYATSRPIDKWRAEDGQIKSTL